MTPADLVDVSEEIGGVLVDADRACLPELFGAIPATQEPDGESATSTGREHVPDAVADDDRRGDGQL